MKKEMKGQMKKALNFCFLVLTALSYVCASGIAEVSVSGASKTITKVADKANVTYDIISDLPFGWQNSGFTASKTIASTPSITIIAIPPTEPARIELTYTEALDEYGFYVDIAHNTISIGITNDNYQYTIDEFAMTIYAHFDEIELSGNYSTSIDASTIQTAAITVGGSVDADVFSLDASNLEVTASSSAEIMLSGTVDTAQITSSGSAEIYAKNLVCGTANIVASSSSELELMLNGANLDVTASGSAQIMLSGAVDNATITASSSSSLYAKNLMCGTANIVSSGSSEVELMLNGANLDANASSSAEIMLSGAVDNAILTTSGSASIYAKNLTCGTANIVASSSSEVELMLNGSTLDATASGSADIMLSGTVDNAIISTSSSSSLYAKNLICLIAHIKAEGQSSVVLSVKDELRAETTSSAEIQYYGSPTVSVITDDFPTVEQISPTMPI